jgi:hypothetical protein
MPALEGGPRLLPYGKSDAWALGLFAVSVLAGFDAGNRLRDTLYDALSDVAHALDQPAAAASADDGTSVRAVLIAALGSDPLRAPTSWRELCDRLARAARTPADNHVLAAVQRAATAVQEALQMVVARSEQSDIALVVHGLLQFSPSRRLSGGEVVTALEAVLWYESVERVGDWSSHCGSV